MRLDDTFRRSPELVREKPQEDVLHTGVLALEKREVVAEHRPRLTGFERLDGRRPARVREEQRQLAEALTGADDVDEDAVTERSSLAAGGNVTREVTPRVSGQVVGVQVARTQVARTQVASEQRAQTAVSIQRHLVQMRVAMRFAQLRALLR